MISEKYDSKLQFGMPTLIELNSIRENVELCKELGLHFVELNMNMPYCTILGCSDKNNSEVENFINELNNLKNEFGIYFTIHIDENFNFADFNSYVKEAYYQTIKSVIENAKKIHCPILNMHINHGIYFTLPTEKVFLFKKYNQKYMNDVLEFSSLCQNKIENNVENENQILPKVVIENTDGWKDFEKVAINKFLENSNFGLTLDIGHSESIGNIDEEFILENKNKLFHFHIHDGTLPDEKTKSYGKNHLTLGTGKINLEERLNLAKECNGRCVIETKTVDSLRKSVEWLKENKYFENK